MPTLGDVFRVYVKPTLNGLMVIRKRNVNRQSPNVMAIMEQLKAKKGAPDHPAKKAHERCGEYHEVLTYIPGEGYKIVKRCKAKAFYSALSEAMFETIKGKSTKKGLLGK